MTIESEKQKIRETIEEWMRASAAGDTDRVLQLMAEDVVFLQPGKPPMRGRQAFVDASRRTKGQMINEGKPDIREIHVVSDHAFVWNHLSLTVTPKGGAPIHREGDILSVFRRGPEGRWVLFRDANLLTTIEAET